MRPPPPDDCAPTRRAPSRTAIKRELRRLVRQLADEMFEVLDDSGLWSDARSGSLEGDPSAKRVRRTAEALDKVMARILADLRTRREPVAIGKVAAALGMTSRQIAHPMSLLVAEGKVIRKGERRGARYRVAPARRRTARPPKPTKAKATIRPKAAKKRKR